jgi:hypothetical protein
VKSSKKIFIAPISTGNRFIFTPMRLEFQGHSAIHHLSSLPLTKDYAALRLALFPWVHQGAQIRSLLSKSFHVQVQLHCKVHPSLCGNMNTFKLGEIIRGRPRSHTQMFSTCFTKKLHLRLFLSCNGNSPEQNKLPPTSGGRGRDKMMNETHTLTTVTGFIFVLRRKKKKNSIQFVLHFRFE